MGLAGKNKMTAALCITHLEAMQNSKAHHEPGSRKNNGKNKKHPRKKGTLPFSRMLRQE
jgi:hypothetical protein